MWQYLFFILVFRRVLAPLQDHLLLPAGLLVLQRVPAVSGLRSQAEAAAAAPHHLRPPPPRDLPEAAVGPGAAAARVPAQQVSKQA